MVNGNIISQRKIETNRRNALKSTGPRTAEGKQRSRMNALRHGLGARAFREAMRELGEDPSEFNRFHRDLVDSLQPTNALEAKLVEDLAKLWWKKARAERAQSGVQILEVERLHLDRMREFHEINRRSMDQPRDEVAQVGLLRAKNCRGKFDDALKFLDLLIARLERGKGFEDAEEALEGLYGPSPTWRGSLILKYFRRLIDGEEPESGDELVSQPDACAQAPSSGPEADASRTFSTRAALIELLLEERMELTEEYELFLREHLEVSRASRDARLAPTDTRWTWILRMDNYLDRQIERKMRLLLQLRGFQQRFGSRRIGDGKRNLKGLRTSSKDVK